MLEAKFHLEKLSPAAIRRGISLNTRYPIKFKPIKAHPARFSLVDSRISLCMADRFSNTVKKNPLLAHSE
jgi:hypothetical protein